MFDWNGLIKRYVWDDETTPYFVPVQKLSREQADSELFFFSFLFSIFFAVLSILAFVGKLPIGPSKIATGYCFTVVAAAVFVGTIRFPWAAVYCLLAPAVIVATLFVAGFPAKMELFDQLIFLALVLAVLRYTFRVVRITMAYPNLPSRPPKSKPRRKLF